MRAVLGLAVLGALLSPAVAGPGQFGPSMPKPTPKVKLQVEDQFAKGEQLKVLIKKKKAPLLKCYNAALKQDPDFQGTWKFMLEIAKAGTVKVSPTSHRSGAETFETCLQGVLKQLRFKPGHADTGLFGLVFEVS